MEPPLQLDTCLYCDLVVDRWTWLLGRGTCRSIAPGDDTVDVHEDYRNQFQPDKGSLQWRRGRLHQLPVTLCGLSRVLGAASNPRGSSVVPALLRLFFTCARCLEANFNFAQFY